MKRLYRILLRIYPAGFREEYASEMERDFLDDYREAEGRRARIRLGWRAVADLAATAPAQLARELRQDLHYAARTCFKRPVATTLVVTALALALAIGATTGIFSVVNALLIRSLPFRAPERLVDLSYFPMGPKGPASPGRNGINAWRNKSPYLEDAAFYAAQPMNLGIGRESFRVTVCESTANFLRLLGTEPDPGRGFSADDDIPGQNRVAVIAHGLWLQAFGGDRKAIGATIRLNEEPVTVIGVAPPDFDFPEKTAVWTPTAYRGLPSSYWVNQTVGRLKPGVSFDQASALFRAEADRIRAGRWKPTSETEPRLYRLQDRLAGPVRPASLVLMGMMAFVLLVACANLAHLLLSRVAERRQELVIRASLGASRARLTRQLITEATVLTVVAAIAGLAVAQWTSRLAGLAQPPQLALRQYSVLDWRVVAFALGLAAVTGVVFGVLPALLIGRMQPRPDVIRTQPGMRGSAAGRMRAVLIALQAALTVTLAAGSFSMGQTFLKLMNVDLGYRTNRVVTMNVSFPGGDTAPYVREALERLRAVPGVELAAAASYMPLVAKRTQEGTFFRLDPGDPKRSARVILVSPDYFRAMETPLLEGREFSESDRHGASPVVIVTEEFARKYPNRKLVGSKMYLEPASVWVTIVGVVRSQRHLGPESDRWEAIYRPMDQYEQWGATFVAKVRGNPERYLAACRAAVQGTDRSVPVFDVKTLDQRLADALARPRFYTNAIVFLAGFALLLAAIGAYGVARHSVSQRRHEIGVRIAVGGPPGRVRAMVFRQSMTPVCIGVVLGLAGAAGLGQFLKHLMVSVEPMGAWLCGGAALAIVMATACAVWTATSTVVRTDPTAAFRVE